VCILSFGMSLSVGDCSTRRWTPSDFCEAAHRLPGAVAVFMVPAKRLQLKFFSNF
jgi:hypothetical protein